MKDERNTIFMQQYEKLMRDTIIAPTDDYNAKMLPINDLIRLNMPKSLYRYRAFEENSIDAFWKDIIYHAKPKDFNDPHDCLVYIDENSLNAKIKELVSFQTFDNMFKESINKESPNTQMIFKELNDKTFEKRVIVSNEDGIYYLINVEGKQGEQIIVENEYDGKLYLEESGYYLR